MHKNLLILSTSTIHGSSYLDYCSDAISDFFSGREELLFIPYARPGGMSHDAYTELARKKFNNLGFGLRGIHEFDDPRKAVAEAAGIFTGGGNTFVLLNELYKEQLITPIRACIEAGTPYMGSSAGSNITGQSIRTTNDMPITYPPSFEALGLVPFNINPHYLDPNPDSRHMGETRETRIKEFHEFNDIPVAGLREGSWLEVHGQHIELKGPHSMRLFTQKQTPKEYRPDEDISFLLNP